MHGKVSLNSEILNIILILEEIGWVCHVFHVVHIHCILEMQVGIPIVIIAPASIRIGWEGSVVKLILQNIFFQSADHCLFPLTCKVEEVARSLSRYDNSSF